MPMVTGNIKDNVTVKPETTKTGIGSIPAHVLKNRALYCSVATSSLNRLV